MRNLRHLFLVWPLLLLTLLLTSCNPAGEGRVVEVQAAILPTDEQPATATQTPTPTPAKECPVTLPHQQLFTPPHPYPQSAPWDGWFWYGSDLLWTQLRKDGIWPAGTYKMFWWRVGYSWTGEPEPDLTVTGKRLDGPAPLLDISEATNAYHSDFGGSAMLLGVEFPALGCWEVTGHYGDHELTFTMLVGP